MDVNTVLLPVDEYNELRDFKKSIEEGKTIVYYYAGYNLRKRCYTTDEAVLDVIEANEILMDEARNSHTEVCALRKDIKELTEKKVKALLININAVKRMTVWEFLKWRKL